MNNPILKILFVLILYPITFIASLATLAVIGFALMYVTQFIMHL